MESISIFDIFKIGVGPSSSHTLGPWRAALQFVHNLKIDKVNHITIHLYGSLSKTGKGHATDKAVVLGLLGHDPQSIDTDNISQYILETKKQKQLIIKGKIIPFEIEKNIIFEKSEHQLHPNTLVFHAYHEDSLIKKQTFTSVGGGFIESELTQPKKKKILPYPIKNGQDILNYTEKQRCKISDIVYQNELAIRPVAQITKKTNVLIQTILTTVYEGCTNNGILPGGLNVTRRANSICNSLLQNKSFNSQEEWIELIKSTPKDFTSVNKWISCFALAANEQNAAMGRIVTSPTNGAAGVIPSVLLYFMFFCEYQSKSQLQTFLFTAGEIGCLFKKGATISAAVGGCQAEIGVSSAMAAAALTEALGGTPEQSLMAAEIAMEHHLGLTCDPIKGLVQVPCIERNAMGAIKAITAAQLALESNPKSAIVNLDTVIKTMWDVANDMDVKYKETSEGGLAINYSVNQPNC